MIMLILGTDYIGRKKIGNSDRTLYSSINFLIWPSWIIPFNIKSKGYQKPGGPDLPPPHQPHLGGGGDISLLLDTRETGLE